MTRDDANDILGDFPSFIIGHPVVFSETAPILVDDDFDRLGDALALNLGKHDRADVTAFGSLMTFPNHHGRKTQQGRLFGEGATVR